MTESEKILHEFLEAFKKACPGMWEVSKYLRMRRSCPAADRFEKDRRIIDNALEIALTKFQDLKKSRE